MYTKETSGHWLISCCLYVIELSSCPLKRDNNGSTFIQHGVIFKSCICEDSLCTRISRKYWSCRSISGCSSILLKCWADVSVVSILYVCKSLFIILHSNRRCLNVHLKSLTIKKDKISARTILNRTIFHFHVSGIYSFILLVLVISPFSTYTTSTIFTGNYIVKNYIFQ